MEQAISCFFMGLMTIRMGCAADHKVMLVLAPEELQMIELNEK